MKTDRIRLAHGNGGLWTRDLIREVFLPAFRGEGPDGDLDAAVLDIPGGRWAFTTDAFVVSPLEFPGGTIGSLAIHGTCNDLAAVGARPRFASAAFVLEEGLEVRLLERVVEDMARAAAEAGIRLVAGDTKVVEKGHGDGLYIAMSGVGEIPEGRNLHPSNIGTGDRWLVSGPVGDHGAAILCARGSYALEAPVTSDSANLSPLVEALLAEVPGTRFLRDATRGGLAQVVVEACSAAGLGSRLREGAIPVRPAVTGICEILGFDPLYLACEGRLVACVPAQAGERALEALRRFPSGSAAACIGEVGTEPGVVLETRIGGERPLEELEEDPVPRISGTWDRGSETWDQEPLSQDRD